MAKVKTLCFDFDSRRDFNILFRLLTILLIRLSGFNGIVESSGKYNSMPLAHFCSNVKGKFSQLAKSERIYVLEKIND